MKVPSETTKFNLRSEKRCLDVYGKCFSTIENTWDIDIDLRVIRYMDVSYVVSVGEVRCMFAAI